MRKELTMETKNLMAWIAGSIYGVFVTYEQIGHSLLTIISSCIITLITFFLTRWLSRKFPRD